jgi:hypothetical protein
VTKFVKGGMKLDSNKENAYGRFGTAARHCVEQIFADFVRRLQTEEMEVAQQVVVDRKELNIQLRQRQAS